MLRTWTISGVSYRKQPRPLSHIRSSLYFSWKRTEYLDVSNKQTKKSDIFKSWAPRESPPHAPRWWSRWRGSSASAGAWWGGRSAGRGCCCISLCTTARKTRECSVNIQPRKPSRWAAVRMLYVAEVILVHLDLFDVGGVIGGVDFVLLLVIVLPIQALRDGKETWRDNGEFSVFVISERRPKGHFDLRPELSHGPEILPHCRSCEPSWSWQSWRPRGEGSNT